MNNLCRERSMCRSFLVFHADLLSFDKGIGMRFVSVQVDASHSYPCNLTVFVSGIIIDAFRCIAAAGVDRFFVKVTDFYASLLLGNTAENVKYLADTC